MRTVIKTVEKEKDEEINYTIAKKVNNNLW